MFKIFTKEIIKVHTPPEYIVFNVQNFNNWFCDPNNVAIYANSGIYLRLDKLSESHVYDYIEKCYGIKNNSFLWSKPTHEIVREFVDNIRKNWIENLNK